MATAIVRCRREAARETCQFEAAAGGEPAAAPFRHEGAGARGADVTLSLGEAGGKGVEVRITVASDDAQGQMELGKVVLRRLSTRQVEGLSGSDVFTAVLDL